MKVLKTWTETANDFDEEAEDDERDYTNWYMATAEDLSWCDDGNFELIIHDEIPKKYEFTAKNMEKMTCLVTKK